MRYDVTRKDSKDNKKEIKRRPQTKRVIGASSSQVNNNGSIMICQLPTIPHYNKPDYASMHIEYSNAEKLNDM